MRGMLEWAETRWGGVDGGILATLSSDASKQPSEADGGAATAGLNEGGSGFDCRDTDDEIGSK